MTHDESPTARALLTLELLQSSPGITAERLGERLRVTERAARRYVAILREAGIPVDSERGPYGGYRLGRGMRTPLIFTTAEALGLVMALLDGHHDIADATGPVGSAVGKIGRVLPESLASTVAAVRRTISAVPDRSAISPDPDITTSLVQACDSQRRTTIAYTTENGNERKMVVDPWAVVVRHARWYLLCWSHTVDARRVLRVDRMGAVDIEETTFVRPEIDPATEVEEHLGEGWAYSVEIIFESSFAQVNRDLPRVLGRVEPIDDEHCRLIGSTNNPEWYAEELARRSVPFRVVDGDEVRHCVAALGQRLLDAAKPR